MVKKCDLRKMVQILMQLDSKSLLLIDSGAKLLLARQNMDKQADKKKMDYSAKHTGRTA